MQYKGWKIGPARLIEENPDVYECQARKGKESEWGTGDTAEEALKSIKETIDMKSPDSGGAAVGAALIAGSVGLLAIGASGGLAAIPAIIGVIKMSSKK